MLRRNWLNVFADRCAALIWFDIERKTVKAINFVNVGNVAEAHIKGFKAAEALAREAAQGAEPGKQVCGESFFITNDDPRHFYDLMRPLWQATAYDTSSLIPTIIPSKVALAAASASDWATWASTLRFRKPRDFWAICLLSRLKRVSGVGLGVCVTITNARRPGTLLSLLSLLAMNSSLYPYSSLSSIRAHFRRCTRCPLDNLFQESLHLVTLWESHRPVFCFWEPFKQCWLINCRPSMVLDGMPQINKSICLRIQ